MSQLSQLTQALSQNSTFAEVGSLSADMTDAFSTWKDEVCNKQNGYGWVCPDAGTERFISNHRPTIHA